ncbi:MAG: hypothetical protein KAK00_08200 [Nanoarchaeota archaeon]|nr:hypothetical protein [Nanoarchaeota archaeon]
MDWIRDNDYPISSPRHRGIYAEIIFKKFCNLNNIFTIKINPYMDIIEQIPYEFFTKKQLKNLRKIGKIDWDFFCLEKGKACFMEIKMGTSNISHKQRELLKMMGKIKVALFRVFEDADVFIRRLN